MSNPNTGFGYPANARTFEAIHNAYSADGNNRAYGKTKKQRVLCVLRGFMLKMVILT
jgi:hypothetical protein